jgi:hypothetical protein
MEGLITKSACENVVLTQLELLPFPNAVMFKLGCMIPSSRIDLGNEAVCLYQPAILQLEVVEVL